MTSVFAQVQQPVVAVRRQELQRVGVVAPEHGMRHPDRRIDGDLGVGLERRDDQPDERHQEQRRPGQQDQMQQRRLRLPHRQPAPRRAQRTSPPPASGRAAERPPEAGAAGAGRRSTISHRAGGSTSSAHRQRRLPQPKRPRDVRHPDGEGGVAEKDKEEVEECGHYGKALYSEPGAEGHRLRPSETRLRAGRSRRGLACQYPTTAKPVRLHS